MLPNGSHRNLHNQKLNAHKKSCLVCFSPKRIVFKRTEETKQKKIRYAAKLKHTFILIGLFDQLYHRIIYVLFKGFDMFTSKTNWINQQRAVAAAAKKSGYISNYNSQMRTKGFSASNKIRFSVLNAHGLKSHIMGILESQNNPQKCNDEYSTEKRATEKLRTLELAR